MPYQITYKLETSRFGECVILNRYKDSYSLVAGGRSKNATGTVYMKWCFPAYDGVPTTNMIPMGVNLGCREEAISVLRYFLDQLTKT